MESLSLLEFFIRAFIGVFVILDPIGGSTHFLALAAHRSEMAQKRIAKRACSVAFFILVFFSLAGSALFAYFGITLAALKIAGGILLFTVALSMLQGKRLGMKTSPEEEQEAPKLEDVSIIPLAIPLLSGPGAITTVMVFAGEAESLLRIAGLLVAIFLSVIIAYMIFLHAALIKKGLKKTGIKILTRIMGLIMSVIAVQFVINGVTDIMPLLVRRIT